VIRKELDFVWITSDSKRFLNKSKASKHENFLSENKIKKDNGVGKDIVSKWIKKIQGEKDEH
tara:strand:- start:837 stop:1022 length:186 start_codon:yes stop_codon:yes gene_type:complete